MPVRVKKLIGTLILIVLVVLYALIATAFAVAKLGQSGPLVHLVYFMLTGVLWIVPAMVVIRWMIRPPRERAT